MSPSSPSTDMRSSFYTITSRDRPRRGSRPSLRASILVTLALGVLPALVVPNGTEAAGAGKATAPPAFGPASEAAVVKPFIEPALTITSVEPSSGSTAGGTSVTIKGTGFGATPANNTVTIGGNAATVTAASASSLTVTTPAGTAGPASVVVTNTSDGSTATDSGGFTYVAPPLTITSVKPSSGSTAGGTSVTIEGTGFGATPANNSVTIGGKAAMVTAASATSLTVTTPRGNAGPASVVVTNTTDGLSATETGGFTYVAPPLTITSVEPASGSTAGGTPVTIKGTGFGTTPADNTVTIGGGPATVTAASATSLTVTTPPGTAGPAPVVVTNTSDSSTATDAGAFTYVEPAPTITSVEPSTGSTSGGTSVTIKGTGFGSGVIAVEFGSVNATSFKASTGGTITAVSPPGSGTVDVTVRTAGGTSAASVADRFTYTAPGAVNSAGSGNTTNTVTLLPTLPPRLAGLPAPVLARSANVALVVGAVSVRLPGTRAFVALSSVARLIPYGTVVEARHGEVSVAAADAKGGIQSGFFFDGQFMLTQASNGRVLATLTGGDFSVCPPHNANSTHRKAKYAAPMHLVRRLWGNVIGSFSMKGTYAEGAVQSAEWLTEDMCEDTLVLSTRDHVNANDLVRHRQIDVGAEHIYIATRTPAPGPPKLSR
jgi:IPT/TIG domain-containing protein